MHIRIKLDRDKWKQSFSMEQSSEKSLISLDYRGKIPAGHSLRQERNGTDESLGKIGWGITIYSMDTIDSTLLSEKIIGKASHHEAFQSEWDPMDSFDESIYAWVHVEPKVFEMLVNCQLGGIDVDSIVFEVEGESLEHGWEPDGSTTVWNVSKNSHLTIKSVLFQFAPNIEDTWEVDPLAPVDEKPALIVKAIDWLQATHSRLLWTNALLLAVLIAVLWR
jgi:hypothetical protein